MGPLLWVTAARLRPGRTVILAATRVGKSSFPFVRGHLPGWFRWWSGGSGACGSGL